MLINHLFQNWEPNNYLNYIGPGVYSAWLVELPTKKLEPMLVKIWTSLEKKIENEKLKKKRKMPFEANIHTQKFQKNRKQIYNIS